MSRHVLDGKVVLVTGGTGSFGRAFLDEVVPKSDCVVRVFSRDEYKQSQLRERHGEEQVRYMLGDVRDRERLTRAARGADLIIHAAALKQVLACEYDPFEAVQTNVVGAENVVSAAIDAGVPRVIALSTDKAVNPINLYGATKLCAEKIIVQGNTYAVGDATRLSCVRYGNVVSSRGSVVPLFRRQREEGELTITDERMTRFWITLSQAVDHVLEALELMRGGEVFVPHIPSMRVVDLAEAIAPGVDRRIIGIRPGEKIHEVLITPDESRHTVVRDGVYTVLPEHHWWTDDGFPGGDRLDDGFSFSSGNNDRFLDVEELRALLP
jgi:UDP-N-acetylglucosamine 4,6-dehydratase/5-epimerase